ncbi:1-phosphatidylinositol 4,5-bisphosphate phosphodiesterase delta-1a isoform X1 [Erpetoichthys calabaricus]|uniref:1-phosphatidylinositol 4,5-bisphosphate phosphodiesterase delta-1a isoform X1 n=1 Tax=Erpetoichthys calabaricus TaxID=27687 RepID=UPI0022340CD5|nr:1-phosphatidylinositol 4,5-bisphosphate phosphodiesterase delta-1a isoform X1 [Erpetoichthys calabaricus]
MQCVRKKPKRTVSEEKIFAETSRKIALQNSVRLGLQDDEHLQFLLKGSNLDKVKSNSWRKPRFFKLQDDCSTIWHESRKLRKVPSRQTFSIEDVQEVRLGRHSEGLQKYAKDVPEEQCFSIIFKGNRKNLDLIASSKEEASQWAEGLKKLIKFSNNMSNKQKLEHWIHSCIRKSDTNFDNKMNFKELKHFLQEVNIKVDDLYAKKLFEKCDKSKSNMLEDSEIEEFYKLLTKREEIDVIFNKYAETEELMSTDDLLKFLQTEQHENVTVEKAHLLIEMYEPDDIAKSEKHMTKDGFLMYLQSEEGQIFNPAHSRVCQEMMHPLSHYFISSSHNTYLVQDQLKGASSTEAYIRALTRGCRCVELDCWDGPNGEPVIYHGYTLTSKILFKDVITTVKEYAFKSSPYPVILSLENHCTLEQQKVMARHLREILGDMLQTTPVSGKDSADLPSPEMLKGKILIKGKKLSKLEHNQGSNITHDVETVSEEDEAAEIEDESVKSQVRKNSKNTKLKLAYELSEVVIYCRSVHFPGFDNAKKNQTSFDISSFVESKALKLVQDSANDFITHNMRQLSRIYPAGKRTDSSNYNPVDLWIAGCQIVALNFQTPCLQMDLYQGMFKQNGHCGYILKPKFLRESTSQFNPMCVTSGEWLQPKKLHVMIISGQQLPKVNQDKINSIVDPLVKVEIFGVPRDVQKAETHHLNNNGFNPMWNKTYVFDISVPQLAFIRFLVEDYDGSSFNDFVAQYTLPVTSIQNGYRHIPLLSKTGNPCSSSSLFVNILLEDQ